MYVHACGVRAVFLAWTAWHLHVASAPKYWTQYFICHSVPFFRVSERSGRNRRLRETSCKAYLGWVIHSCFDRDRLGTGRGFRAAIYFICPFQSFRHNTCYQCLQRFFRLTPPAPFLTSNKLRKVIGGVMAFLISFIVFEEPQTVLRRPPSSF